MKLLRVSVVTPSLNKSFKFQSDWPYNNSQVYLLNSIIEDLKEDEDREFKTTNDGYYFSSTVNYPNNKSLVHQHVYMDKNGKITKVEVVDKEDNVQIMMKFNKQEFNKKFDKDYFELSKLLNMNSKTEQEAKKNSNSSNREDNNTSDNQTTNENNTTENNSNTNATENNTNNTTNNNTNNNTNSSTNDNSTNSTETGNQTQENNTTNNTTTQESNTSQKNNQKTNPTAAIEDVIYPMYLPSNTYLTSQKKVDTDNGQRLILTFGGDSSFVLVEETSSYIDGGLIIPVSGEFDFLADVIGVIGDTSLTWQSNGIEYYMTSDSVTTAEMLEIARSISVLPVSK